MNTQPERHRVLKEHASWVENERRLVQLKHVLFDRCEKCAELRTKLDEIPLWFIVLCIIFGEYVYVPLFLMACIAITLVIQSVAYVFSLW